MHLKSAIDYRLTQCGVPLLFKRFIANMPSCHINFLFFFDNGLTVLYIINILNATNLLLNYA